MGNVEQLGLCCTYLSFYLFIYSLQKIIGETWEMAQRLRVIVVQAQRPEYKSHHWPQNLDVTTIL